MCLMSFTTERFVSSGSSVIWQVVGFFFCLIKFNQKKGNYKWIKVWCHSTIYKKLIICKLMWCTRNQTLQDAVIETVNFGVCNYNSSSHQAASHHAILDSISDNSPRHLHPLIWLHASDKPLQIHTDSHKNLVHVHRRLRWRFHEKQTVVICIRLCILQADKKSYYKQIKQSMHLIINWSLIFCTSISFTIHV